MKIYIKTIASPDGKPMPYTKDMDMKLSYAQYFAERIIAYVSKGGSVADYQGKVISPDYIKEVAETTGDTFERALELEAIAMGKDYWLNDWHLVTMAAPSNVSEFISGQRAHDEHRSFDPQNVSESFLSGWGVAYELSGVLSNG